MTLKVREFAKVLFVIAGLIHEVILEQWTKNLPNIKPYCSAVLWSAFLLLQHISATKQTSQSQFGSAQHLDCLSRWLFFALHHALVRTYGIFCFSWDATVLENTWRLRRVPDSNRPIRSYHVSIGIHDTLLSIPTEHRGLVHCLKTLFGHNKVHELVLRWFYSCCAGVKVVLSVLDTSSSISSPSTLGVNNSTSMGLRRPAGRKTHTVKLSMTHTMKCWILLQ